MTRPTETFFGRAAALADIDSHVAASRLVTIVGLGGVGKTRLATEWMHGRGPATFGAMALARLDGLEDGPSLLGEVAAAVGMPQTGGQPFAAAIGDWLRGRDFLLVLDNCEHVLDGVVPLLEEILGRAADLTVLATSRRPLGLAPETLIWLEPLPVPARGAAPAILADNPAVNLFMARARAQGAGPAISEALDAVAALCRAVDGLPLALELAAGWVVAMPVDEVLAQLNTGLAILQHPGARHARHATLTDTMAWSHSLLSQRARMLLRRLAVFPVGFSLPAIRQCCVFDGLESDDVLPALRELVESSLVRFDRPGSRYHLLNTVRQFARSQLAQAHEEAAVGARHAEFIRGLGLQGRAANFVPEHEWLPRLLPQVEDFHACLRWLMANGRSVQALELAVALATFWWLSSRHREGIQWLQAALAQARGPAVLHAAAHFGLGFLSVHDTGDWAAGAQELDQGIALLDGCQEPGADLVRGYLLCLRGECENMAQRPQAGLALGLQGAELIARHPDDRWGHGFAAWNVGFGWECAQDLPRAAQCYEEVIGSQRGGSRLVLMIGCQSLGRICEQQGDPEAALPLYDEALSLWRAMDLKRLGDVHGTRAQALVDCARVRMGLGVQTDQARALAQEAALLAEELQDEAAARAAQQLARALAGAAARRGVFRRQGAIWRVGLDGHEALLPDSKGLRQLRHLLQAAGVEVPAAELAAAADGEPREIDAGSPMLDAAAVRQYRARLRALDQVLALEEEILDEGRRRQAIEEHQAISRELARAQGLRGRVRPMGSPLERMRVNVTRTLRAAVADVEAAAPDLGRFLSAGLKTGGFCVFRPLEPVAWEF